MRTGLDLCRYARDFRDQLGAALGPITVCEIQILRSADLPARHFHAIDEDDERRSGFHAARVQTRIDAVPLQKVEVIFPVGRKDMGEAHAAACP